MHKFVRTLDTPPPIQEQTSQVSWSHDEAQKSHGKQIHKPMEYTFWIFSFLP